MTRTIIIEAELKISCQTCEKCILTESGLARCADDSAFITDDPFTDLTAMIPCGGERWRIDARVVEDDSFEDVTDMKVKGIKND